MLIFILRRLGLLVVTAFAMIVATFFLTHSIPSDPARVAVGPEATTESVEAMRRKMGLDKPLIEQFAIYLWDVLHLDLGTSIYDNEPVLDAIVDYAPASIELAVVATVVSVFLGLAIGIYSGARFGGVSEGFLRLGAIAGRAMPPFWLALLLQIVFYRQLSWFPNGARIDLIETEEPRRITGLYLVDSFLTLNWHTFWDSAYHIVLPATALALGGIAEVSRMTTAAVRVELRKEYTRTAYAKGLKGRSVLFRHVVRNALNPVVTIIGIRFGYLLAGTVLVENIFRWPGLGRYMIIAIEHLDFPVIIGVTLFVAIAFTAVNLAVDILHGFLDPRIRHA